MSAFAFDRVGHILLMTPLLVPYFQYCVMNKERLSAIVNCKTINKQVVFDLF